MIYVGFIGDLRSTNPTALRWVFGLTFPPKREK